MIRMGRSTQDTLLQHMAWHGTTRLRQATFTMGLQPLHQGAWHISSPPQLRDSIHLPTFPPRHLLGPHTCSPLLHLQDRCEGSRSEDPSPGKIYMEVAICALIWYYTCPVQHCPRGVADQTGQDRPHKCHDEMPEMESSNLYEHLGTPDSMLWWRLLDLPSIRAMHVATGWSPSHRA